MTQKTTDPLSFAFDVYKGEVVVAFNRPVQWMALTPAIAREIAKNLNRAADEADAPQPSNQEPKRALKP